MRYFPVTPWRALVLAGLAAGLLVGLSGASMAVLASPQQVHAPLPGLEPSPSVSPTAPALSPTLPPAFPPQQPPLQASTPGAQSSPTATLPVQVSTPDTQFSPTPTAPVQASTPDAQSSPTSTAPVQSDDPALQPPDLALHKFLLGRGPFFVDQHVAYVLQVKNVSGVLLKGQQVTITDTFPQNGLGDIQAQGRGWKLTSLGQIGDNTVITAIYTAPIAVNSGVLLPRLFLSGTLTSAVQPTFTNTASVTTPGDSNPANNTSSVTIHVFPNCANNHSCRWWPRKTNQAAKVEKH